jgi:hypothetical protein
MGGARATGPLPAAKVRDWGALGLRFPRSVTYADAMQAKSLERENNSTSRAPLFIACCGFSLCYLIPNPQLRLAISRERTGALRQ